MPSIQGINYTLKNLKDWMKPAKRHVSVLFQPASNKVHYQPKGCCRCHSALELPSVPGHRPSGGVTGRG